MPTSSKDDLNPLASHLRMPTLLLAFMACFSVATTNASTHNSPTSRPSSPALTHQQHSASTATAPAAQSWTQANDTVGQFLRGHIDLLRWEMNNPNQANLSATTQTTPKDALSLDQALKLSLRNQPQWLQRPNMSAAERSRLNTQLQAQVLRVQRAWTEAVSARQSKAHIRLVLEAAEAGAELAQRMAHIGNWSRARQMQEELLLWEARTQVQNADLKALQTHLTLWQMVGGKTDTTQLTDLPDLPDLPSIQEVSSHQLSALESRALAAHFEWTNLQADAERLIQAQTATSLSQAQRAMQPDRAAAPGNNLTWPPLNPVQLPANIPWSHSTENALQTKAQADAMQRQIRADVRLAHAAYLLAHTNATQNQVQVLRLHTALEHESLLRYNGMLKSTWDLLASARQRIQSKLALHQAQTQAWLAWADLQAVLNGLPYTGQLNLDGGNSSSSKPSAGH